MNFAGIALLDDLFPSTRKQTTQLAKDCFIADWILQSAAFNWCPTPRHRSGRINIRLEVERHFRSLFFPKRLLDFTIVLSYKTVAHHKSPPWRVPILLEADDAIPHEGGLFRSLSHEKRDRARVDYTASPFPSGRHLIGQWL